MRAKATKRRNSYAEAVAAIKPTIKCFMPHCDAPAITQDRAGRPICKECWVREPLDIKSQ